MKKNVMLLSCAALLALALAGCAQSTAQADYIGTDAAKAIALEAAGIGEADATFTTAELETRNNTPYYEVDFTAGGQEYDYDIDALTGTVIAGSQQAAGSTDGSTGDTAITADKAKEIALNHAGLTADQVTFVRSNLDQDDGRTCYDVEFYTADYTEYDYEIDARTGEVLSFDYDAEYYQPTRPSGDASSYIGLDEAKRIALSHVSGAAEANIRSAHLDYDDGRAEYEIEIIYGTTEYDFEIDAVSGAVISQDMDSIYD